MPNDNSKAENYLGYKNKITSIVKNRIFDIIAVFTVIIMSLISLSALEIRDITLKDVADIMAESFPFYLAATMLSRNYYTKGAYLGKEQDCFISAVAYYSEQVTKLDGKSLSILPKFCREYNDKTLKGIQETLLHSVAITMDQFHKYDDKAKRPLKIVPYKELRKLYGNEVAINVEKCKKAKVKGLNPNILLSNLDNADSTDIGYSEKQLANKRTYTYAVSYLFSVVFMTLIGVKSILRWGWIGLFLTLFKLAFVIITACIRYFEGYEDITINVVDHLYRKTDILKEFDYWRCLLNKNEEVDGITSTPVEQN